MVELLRDLGVVVDHPEPNIYEVSAGDVDWLFVPLEAAAKMRASFILLGPLLARFGRVIISNPGGDRIGRRPVDLHVEAMRALGATIDYRNGYYFAQAPGRLRGGEVEFPHVTVMGTENAMLAATLADGHTTIRPAAREPEVDDLIGFLQAMGAEVQRTAPGRHRGRGPPPPARRHAPRHRRPHRGRHVRRGRRHHAAARSPCAARRRPTSVPSSTCLREVGVDVSVRADRITVRGAEPGSGAYRAMDIETAPYPGLATDLQPPTSVLLTQASGRSTVHESIFEDRLEWLTDLRHMGAQVEVTRRPPRHHQRARRACMAPTSRWATCAPAPRSSWAPWPPTARSTISGVHHVRRGYEDIERKLLDLGAHIEPDAGHGAA